VLALLRGRLDNLAEVIDAEPGLVNKRFSELDCGQTGGRLLTAGVSYLVSPPASPPASRRTSTQALSPSKERAYDATR
jgi:hypothetical protein